LLSRVVTTAYPVADIVILGLLARILVAPGARTASFRFLVAAFMLVLGADSLYGTLMQYGLYEGGLIDVGWIVGYSGIAVALLHPSVRTLAAPSVDAPPRLTNRRLVVLAVMTMIAPVLFAVTAHEHLTLSLSIAISAGAVILFLLVVARVAGLNRALDASMQDVVRAQQARDRMLRQTLRASEDQRSTIANELHDGPLQHLTALLYRLQGARASTSNWDSKVASFQDAVSSEITSIRRMMTTLRPGALVERGLEGSLRDYADDVFAGTPTSCDVHVDLRERPSLDLETLIYRIAQESITDAADAGATMICVSVADVEAAIELTIGSDSQVASHANPDEDVRLFSVKERVEMVGGEFAVERSNGRVTSRARFPEGVNV
jgi:signal transduction histidine kinase